MYYSLDRERMERFIGFLGQLTGDKADCACCNRAKGAGLEKRSLNGEV